MDLWRWCQDLQTAVRPSGHAGCLKAGEAAAVGDQPVGQQELLRAKKRSFVLFIHRSSLIAELADTHAVRDHTWDCALNCCQAQPTCLDVLTGRSQSFGAARGLNVIRLLHRLWTEEALIIRLLCAREAPSQPVTVAQQLVLIAASLWCMCLACGVTGQWNNCKTPWFTARNNLMNGKQK